LIELAEYWSAGETVVIASKFKFITNSSKSKGSRFLSLFISQSDIREDKLADETKHKGES